MYVFSIASPYVLAVLKRLKVEFDPGCEAMIYTTDGTPLQGMLSSPVFPARYWLKCAPVGITGGFGGDRRVEYIIPPAARKSGTHSFIAEATCNGMFGVPWNGDTIQPPDVGLIASSTARAHVSLAEQILPTGFGRSCRP